MSGAVYLTIEETRMLAYKLCVERLANAEDWCEWEDVPMLDEQGHVLLCDAIEDVRVWLAGEVNFRARAADIDPVEVAERVR